uniref:Uncharacterized protein n=1 Tax=Octopus bimaculoides TaxID=37653 RepID=A0A0L8HRE3_OCTBM
MREMWETEAVCCVRRESLSEEDYLGAVIHKGKSSQTPCYGPFFLGICNLEYPVIHTGMVSIKASGNPVTHSPIHI